MSDPICISFAASQDYRDHIYRRVMNERNYGATAGDSFWMGYEVDPLARYREPEELKPITAPAWRARIDKAKRDIEQHKSEHRVKVMAAALQPSVVKAFLGALNNGKS